MRRFIITSLLAIGLAISNLSFAEELRIKPNAPTRYTVKKGDTLWGISGRYLYKPWNWPNLWGWNKSQIRNPHLIYPGQVLVLSYIDGKPRLGFEGGIPRPHMRTEEVGQAINGISQETLLQFYRRPVIISEKEFSQSARIVAGPESRVILSKGDRVYARGITEPGTYLAYKPNKKITDPDTGALIGFEVEYRGDLVVQKLTGDVQTLEVVGGEGEIIVGDRLIKAENTQPNNFIPHAYDENQKGKVVSIIGGVREAGKYSSIAINLGSKHGVENGHVFGIYRFGGTRTVKDVDNRARNVEIPSEEVGVVMVYRTYENVSYAVIMQSKSEIALGSLAAAPGLDMEYFSRESIEGNRLKIKSKNRFR